MVAGVQEGGFRKWQCPSFPRHLAEGIDQKQTIPGYCNASSGLHLGEARVYIKYPARQKSNLLFYFSNCGFTVLGTGPLFIPLWPRPTYSIIYNYELFEFVEYVS